MDVVAYGPVPEDLPAVPDFVILNEGGELWMADRDSKSPIQPENLEELLRERGASPLNPPRPWREGGWYCVEDDGSATWFERSREKEWRRARAASLLRRAEALRGDPVKKLSMLAAAGSMERVDVPGLISLLEARRESPDESLADIYRRARSEQSDQ